MARIFRQRDIDQMDAANIPQEFVDYYNRLSSERQEKIRESRPELVEAVELLFAQNSATKGNRASRKHSIEDNSDRQSDNFGEALPLSSDDTVHQERETAEKPSATDIAADNVTDSAIETEIDEFEDIRKNIYENEDPLAFVHNELNPVEALAIEDNPTTCPVHGTKLLRKQVDYKCYGGAIFGFTCYCCPSCKRIYIEESKMKGLHKNLKKIYVYHTFYGMNLTTRYLRSITPPYDITEENKIFVPDTWVEENPLCPVDQVTVEEIKCIKHYGRKTLEFQAYRCPACKKIMLRRAKIIELDDQCAEIGVPMLEYESLMPEPPKSIIPKRPIKPRYFIDNGIKREYSYDYIAENNEITFKDTVVISETGDCMLDGHNTRPVLGLIRVDEKHGNSLPYLFKLCYCIDCQKYYMDEIDFRAVYSNGRLIANVLYDLEDNSYQITSGEVFDMERQHLDNLENNITSEIDGIHSQPDYINPYATISYYDDGNLRYAKANSQRKYGLRLELLNSYKDKPYEYRVDLTAEGENLTYYIGAADIELNGSSQVIATSSRLGRDLVHYKTTTVNIGYKNFSIKLSRQFDILQGKLYGYTNLRTDEDVVFRNGITDPFLVRVLNMRKKQHNLIDIFVTIQENQNAIVDVPFAQNIIVQGCAGSGKTMVLLHRLSSLKYNETQFDFSQALILTPNEHLNLHIQGLAEELQIGSIKRLDIEQYYSELLELYDPTLKPSGKIASEMSVRQTFVDYVYSDDFITDFNNAYPIVIAERNELLVSLNALQSKMNQPVSMPQSGNDMRAISQITLISNSLEQIIRQRKQQVNAAKAEHSRLQTQLNELLVRIPQQKENADAMYRRYIARVNTKISAAVDEGQKKYNALAEEEAKAREELDKLKNSLLLLKKQEKIDEILKNIASLQRKMKLQHTKITHLNELYFEDATDISDDTVLQWMSKVAMRISSVQTELRSCKNANKDYLKLLKDVEELQSHVAAAAEKLESVKSELYPQEIEDELQAIQNDVRKYTVSGTFRLVFEKAVSRFKTEHHIGTITGKNHRYDLYAQLLFAIRYYDRLTGYSKFISIDEGQDLALNEYRLIRTLNGHDTIFNIYGDTNQLIKTGRGITDWNKMRKIIRAKQFALNENYRNTNQITRFCNDSFHMSVLQTGVDGAKVREITRKELEGELSALIPGDQRMAILVPRGVQKVLYLKHDLISSEIDKIIGNEIGNGMISFMYVDEVKGVEFDKVFVVANKMSQNEKYIAYTRALSELIVVYDENVDDYDDGSKNDSTLDSKSGKQKSSQRSMRDTLVYSSKH